MSQVDFRDYYELLGVPRTATAEEIKTAYRRLARKYHPDVNPGDASAEARFKEINEAHEVLSDPQKKKRYEVRDSPTGSEHIAPVSEIACNGPVEINDLGGAASFLELF